MVQLIGASLGLGAQLQECAEGPQYLQKTTLSSFDWEFVFPKKNAHNKDELIYQFNLNLSQKVISSMQNQEFPFVIGGDHSIAVGTWNGVYFGLGQEEFGLIWIDSHMDSHTPETTPSNAIHGMPLAGLLGFGPPFLSSLRGISPILKPENICLIGIRSFEEEEAALLQKLGVRIFFMDEIKRRGLNTIFEEAVHLVTKRTKFFGISLDLDVIDPKDAPGVGSPEEDGILSAELLAALPKICLHSSLKAFELVEYNPKYDIDNKTASICNEIVSIILGSRVHQYG